MGRFEASAESAADKICLFVALTRRKLIRYKSHDSGRTLTQLTGAT